MTTNTLAPRSQRQLVRSANRKIAGVCGGIGDYLDVDPTVVRVSYALLTLLTGIVPGVLVYVVLALLMPRAGPAD